MQCAFPPYIMSPTPNQLHNLHLSTGILKKVPKDERRGAIAAELAKFRPSRPDLYVPTNPDCRVVGHIPTSGTPMQSAAKVSDPPPLMTPHSQGPLTTNIHMHSHSAPAGSGVGV
jgi:hypothetical protein